jgi:hypothetical protein
MGRIVDRHCLNFLFILHNDDLQNLFAKHHTQSYILSNTNLIEIHVLRRGNKVLLPGDIRCKIGSRYECN